MRTLFLQQRLTYTGAQLSSLWARRQFGLCGDSIVAFIGPCDVKSDFMVDLEDLRAGARIYSEEMLHFIAEHFDHDLEKAVLRQRLLMALMAESLNSRIGRPQIRRVGDDLYDSDYKLTVSIATLSPVSAMIHAGINISGENAPVPARGLRDYGIPPAEFADEILRRYTDEIARIFEARTKVRGVP